MSRAEAPRHAQVALEERGGAAQAELAEAIETGALRRDPLRFVLAAPFTTLGVFSAAMHPVEAVSETVR